ncbi:hypothetical protein DVH24_034307 [Malus domestica]|uniref:Uncharacterized protein n=1 Tax=Malus domestica TaxID=3750 RepID=A0A498IYI4_MALDO|nr:hypothetical protein DVH24_034307 [Malus domestica]
MEPQRRLLFPIFIVPPAEDEEDNVDNRRLLPITFYVVQQSSLARLTVEAQNLLIILPRTAVRVGGNGSINVAGPGDGAFVSKSTII